MDARAQDIAERWADGETLAAIGESYGITRERVRQIMKKAGLATADDARRARRERREADEAATRAQLRAWLADNPGKTRAAAAAALGIPAESINRLLGLEARLRFVGERAAADAIPDQEVLDGLRSASKVHGNPLAADRYDEYFPQHGLVSTIRIIQRWGTWNAACAAAGLEVNGGRPTYTRRWTEGQMLEHIADYLQTKGSRGTNDGYDAYARATEDAPSSQTVRNTFRTWSNAKAAAQQVVAARERRHRIG